MIFQPQRYKIEDTIGVPFIDWDEIESFLSVESTPEKVAEVIRMALDKKRLSLGELSVLINAPHRAPIFEAAEKLKKMVYGNRIVLFAPLYVGNRCSNSCRYCSFRVENNEGVRKTLTPEELTGQVNTLTHQGHKRLILVYGEHPAYDAQFIARSVHKVYENKDIRRVNINAAPFSVEDFRTIKDSAIGTFQVFQETYNRSVYAFHHPRGRKSDYDWRLTSLDRAMQAGIDDVGLGALFGLSDNWQGELLGLLRHTNHLEACFNVGPHTISFPRITRAEGSSAQGQYPISDDDFIFIIALLRLAVPYAGLILTARESPAMRDHAIRYGVSQIDGGTKIEIGGYAPQDQDQTQTVGEAQFTINDDRSLSEVIHELIQQDRIPSFCTACYRKGRTGEHFMEFSSTGFIKRFCTPNAILTFAEYLEDSATESIKAKGYELIKAELNACQNREDIADKLERIRNGERDLFY